MTAQRRSWTRWWCRLLVLAVVASLVAPHRAVAAPVETYAKYYVVTSSYQGEPERLSVITQRFLGTTARTTDVLHLNAGRVQPDGGRLTDPDKLRAGWIIVLPWDAYGEGVRYGMLSSVGAPTTPTPGSRPATTPSPARSPAPGTGRCAVTAGPQTGSDWAQQELAAEQAWKLTEGGGVLVAVIDSGVDGSRAPLGGRVTTGVDIVAGDERGDVDCLGSGTAMAGIIAARDDADGSGGGVAPASAVLPVRVVTTTPQSRAADVATGIEVAVSAGSTVIALGGYVDPAAPEVAEAIRTALAHDVVVVAGASTDTGAATVPDDADGLLRVAGVGADGQLAADYRSGGVDLVAPGIDIATLVAGRDGTRASSGTQYAVAFVAGAAALVRAALPNLDAAAVTHRLRVTANPAASRVPDPLTGFGMVDAGAAVTATLPEEERHEGLATLADDATPGPAAVAALVVLLLAAAAGGLAWWSRRARNRSADPPPGEGPGHDDPHRHDDDPTARPPRSPADRTG
ncbi:peptidase S8 and S53 subtilisin kexin sedolisin [Verrucosispora sp. SN26_14.1]|uniref:S8 family serine peptidase n=1 Tax=Verrucosispora sp. SN26_14.1 TaxID=2527879 RepID=UPI00103464C8|nr:S8 family serine peptidase [Verrucosispora sp. SN26_14.1]TBL28781.1 peptidase S8 and S53 subtilisin kexin sedolisin [Verrucosispora sp. SN26_14.1]